MKVIGLKKQMLGSSLGNGDIFSLGNVVYPHYKNVSSFGKTVSTIQVLTIDKDGCCMDKPYDTAKCPTPVEDFLKSCAEEVAKFQNEIKQMADNNVQICICTGRALSWVERIIPILYPPGVDLILVLESGADLLQYNSKTKEFSSLPQEMSCISREDLGQFLELKTSLEGLIRDLGGFVEEGKKNCVSGNAPLNETTANFYLRVVEALKGNEWLDLVHISHSSSAVDISPIGAGKENAINKIAGNRVVASVADEINDFEVLRQETNIILAPNNSNPKVKDLARHSLLGIVSEGPALVGTNQMLEFLNQSRAYLV